MEDKKKSNFGVILITFIITVLICGIFTYFAYTNRLFGLNEKCKSDEKKQCENTCPAVNDKNSLHVYEHLSTGNGYNVYAYLQNQGTISTIVDYKNGLYKVSELGQSSCMFKLNEGLNFSGNTTDCSENESTSGTIFRFDVNTTDVSNAYLMQSYRSDGAEIAIIVFKSGKVNKYEFTDKGKVEEDIFKDYKVKEITDYSCSKQVEGGCDKEAFTVVLEDGTTKEL